MAIATSWRAGRAAKLTGVPYRTVDDWAKKGFVTPSVAEASGRGTQRLYSFADLVALKAAHRLRLEGVSVQALRRAVDYLRARGDEHPLADTYLVAIAGDVYERRGDELLSVLRRPGQAAFAWILDLGELVDELRRELAA